MTLSPTIYARRNGGMLFFRLGSIGGSFYLSRNSEETKAAAKVARRERRQALRAQASAARFWHRAWLSQTTVWED